jgi:hypothetical protein
MGFRAGIKTPGDHDLSFNTVVFATRAEADAYGEELLSRWTLPTGFEVVKVDEPATHTADAQGRIERLRVGPQPKAKKRCVGCGGPAEMYASLGPACPDCYDDLSG